jgi:type I restriction enzyme S subunit
MSKGWEIKSLGEVCEMYQPKTISTKEMVDDGEYPVFGANGIIGKYDKYNHEEPQLLITCRGATCGSVNISEPYSWINGNAMVIKPKEPILDLRFLEFLFRGGIDLKNSITGAAQPQITRQSLAPIKISFPSLPEQQTIVRQLDAIRAETKKLEAIYQQKIKDLDELKKSILKKAFNGELN